MYDFSYAGFIFISNLFICLDRDLNWFDWSIIKLSITFKNPKVSLNEKFIHLLKVAGLILSLLPSKAETYGIIGLICQLSD